MSKYFFSLLILVLPLIAFSAPPTVSEIDLKSYTGKWFEIKSIEAKFQKGCSHTTATYEANADGTISVFNECRKNVDGQIKDSKAKALGNAVDKTNSKLEICFFSILGWCPAKGDYWIYDVGPIKDGQYTYAIVGSPDLKYGWVLSRMPLMDSATLKKIDQKLVTLGYDPKDFKATDQSYK